MASDNRETKVMMTTECPRCGAKPGERCRNPVPHDTTRGIEDRRAQPQRCHSERRVVWSEWKRQIR